MLRATSTRATRGMTLLELLLVMTLLGVLMGIGLGSLSSMNLGRRAAVGAVQNTIRAARNTAIARGAPARVKLDPNAGTLISEAFEVIGTWQFEGGELLRGAFELDGTQRGTLYVDDGFIGQALSFPSTGKALAEVPVHLDASYDLADGFRIECAVRAQTGGGGHALRLGTTIGIDITQNGGIKAWFVPEAFDKTGRRIKGGKLTLETPTAVLPSMTWKRIALEYDRRRLSLYVDGLQIVPMDDNGVPTPVVATSSVWSIDGPLMLGDAQTSFVGSLDNLVISALAASDPTVLPEGVRFDPGVPKEIRFDAGGNLDRETHREPFALGLIFDDGKSQTVRVGMYGTIE